MINIICNQHNKTCPSVEGRRTEAFTSLRFVHLVKEVVFFPLVVHCGHDLLLCRLVDPSGLGSELIILDHAKRSFHIVGLKAPQEHVMEVNEEIASVSSGIKHVELITSRQ